MTKKECIELYNALKGCKLTGMSTNGKMAALEALKAETRIRVLRQGYGGGQREPKAGGLR